MADYHPRRHDREITDADEMARLLRGGKFAVIAMAKDNRPYLVTLNYGFDEEANCLFFHCATKGEKLDFLAENPSVCATIIEDGGYIPEQCEHAYASLVLRGNLVVVEPLEEKKHGLAVLLKHLEKNPAPILKRNIIDDRSYDKVAILRLDISAIAGKKYKQ